MKISRWKLLFNHWAFIGTLWIMLFFSLVDWIDAQIIVENSEGESCTERPTGCDLFCRYGYRKGFNEKCICLCYDPCQGKQCGRDETCLVKRIGNQFAGQCIASIEECLPGVSVSQCFLSPCVLSFCSQNSSLSCVTDYCGGCFAHYFDNKGNEVTKACMQPFKRSQGPVSKPGRCPKLQQGFCLQECENDADCVADRKCCSNDCGKICAPPATEKVGRCPQPDFISQTCRSECREDSECTGVQKCCPNGCANICTFPQQTTECVHLRAAVERLPSRTVAQGYVPICRPDGSFEPIQCNHQFCWCVHPDGTEKFGTKIQAVASQTPNCNVPRTCPSGVQQCSRKCPHGFQTDRIGCPVPNCACRDICAGVQCPNSYETCQLVEPDCITPPCMPVPRCLLNPCPSGKPLTLPQNGVTALCTNTPECGPSHWCHLIGYSGFGFCCGAPASAVRPGTCPLVQPDAGGNCAVGECRVDSDCQQDQKCCYNGCGLSCMAVRGVGPPVKPGVCPTVTENPFGSQCLTLCNNDGDCAGDGKCCKVGCSVRCEKPQGSAQSTVNPSSSGNSISSQLDKKIGDCPLVPSRTHGSAVCTSTCQTDHDCPTVKKCCSNGCGNSCIYPAVASACVHAVISMEVLFGNRAQWIPRCKSDGSFEPVQCAINRSPCWCVDEAGKEVAGTRVLNGTPNCKNPASHCPKQSCGLLCPFGRMMDPRGCEICSCRNPCTSIQCKRPHEICVIMSVECYDPTNCPSQPRCIANICPNGRPFRDHISGLLFQCDTDRPCPNGLWCHNVGFEGQGMCCPAPEVNINEGKCTAVPPLLSPADRLCNLECRSDGECINGLKCCYNGCGLSCVPPAGVPPTSLTISHLIGVDGDDLHQTSEVGHFFLAATGSASASGSGSNAAIAPKNSIPSNITPNRVPQSEFEKPGTCPDYDKNRHTTGGCPTDISDCSTDRHCDAIKKCCNDGCRKHCTYADKTTACHHMKAALETIGEGSSELSPPFIPKCDSEGRFEQVQCDQTFGVCWCVEPDGKEIPGTRLPLGNGRPNCANPRNCPSIGTCTETGCTFGFDLDPTGCPICSCFNPCNKIRCPLPFQICLLEEVKCTSLPCPPVPRCAPNACPQGTPLVSSLTFTAVSCRGNIDCPQGIAFCHKYTDQRGYCCPPPAPHSRAGSCPAVLSGVKGVCQVQCKKDDDCQQNMKCCFNGCGMSCIPGVNIPETKPGTCPTQLGHGGSETCVNSCRSDRDCPDLQKCCIVGCSRVCAVPSGLAVQGTTTSSKLGQCPQVTSLARHLCPVDQRAECATDADCPGIKKCCSNGCTQVCKYAAVTTGCLHQKAAAELLSSGNSLSYQPQCKADGQFEQVQCSPIIGHCWCVDIAGREVPGTRIPAAQNQTPNCNAPRRCPGQFCTLNCPLGFKIGNDGCEQCACFDPCDSVTCSFQYQVCRLMPVDCFTKPCLPIPKCVINPCPSGAPLRDSQTLQVRLCNTTSFGICPGGYFCNRVGFESNQGFCCLGHGNSSTCPFFRLDSYSGKWSHETPPKMSFNTLETQPELIFHTKSILSVSSVSHKTSCKTSHSSCPPVPQITDLTNNGLCTQSCKTDDDCSNSRICCFNGCGMSCFDKPGATEIFEKTGTATVTRTEIRPIVTGTSPKVGSCPSNPLSNPGCVTECQEDADCSDFQKCCPYGCGRKCQLPGNATACIHLRGAVQELGIDSIAPPKCEVNGNFARVQCSEIQGQCWCVDEITGNEIPGTRSGGKPNCDVPSFCPVQCTIQCQHGIVLDSRGCPLNGNCECRQPCKEIVCPQRDHLCFMHKVSCMNKPCPSVPKCKQNPCGNKPPARDSVTGLPMLCGGVFNNECGPQFACQLIPGDRNTGLCCALDGTQTHLSKIGSCPSRPPRTLAGRGCVEDCNSDETCSGTKKCCPFGCSKVCAAPVKSTNCLNLKAAMQTILEQRSQSSSGNTGSLYQPSCDPRSGLFMPIQCDSVSGSCWCVDTQTGIEVYGTRRPGQVASCAARQACTVVCNDRTIICPFGFKVDGKGCPEDSSCKCRNPCDEVTCSSGEVCIMKQISCLQPPCFPIPVCIQNPCTGGTVPATEPRTHALFTCTSDASSRCPADFVCSGIEGNEGVCCPQNGVIISGEVGTSGSVQVSSACPHGEPFSIGGDGRPLPCSSTRNTCPTTHYCLQDEGRPNVGICCVRQSYVCNLRPDTGPCRSQERKWYFDPIQRKCVEFIYGGCRGNLNNFGTRDECERFCKSSTPIATIKAKKPTKHDFAPSNDGVPSERVQIGFSLSGPLLSDGQRIDFLGTFGPKETQITNLKLSRDNTVQFAVAGPGARRYADAISKAVSEGRFKLQYGSSQYKAEPQTMFYEPIQQEPLENEDTPNSAFLGLVISCATFGFVFLLMLVVAVVIVHRRKNRRTPSNSTGTPIPYQNPVYISSNGSEVSRPILDTATDHITARSLPRRKFSMDDMDSMARVNGFYPSSTWRSNTAAINGTTNRGETQLYY